MGRTSGSRLAFFVLSAVLVVPLILGGLAGARTEEEGEDDFYRFLSVFTDALKLVRTVYVEPTDLRVLMAGALDGATDALGPFSQYVPAEQVAAYRRVRGVERRHCGLLVLSDRGVAFAVSVDAGSPAERAGIEPGDIVSKIGGLSTREMPLWQIQMTLADEPGTKVALELIRRGETIDAEIALGRYPTPEPSVTLVGGVTVLRIPSIDATTTAKVASLLETAQRQPLLLDVRGTAGENPGLAYALADLFVDGELGSLFDRGEVIETFSSSQPDIWSSRPISVLVDRSSQGAAELLAAILRHRAEGLVLGEPTFGYAGRTTVVDLSSGGLLQLTDAFYSGPDGEEIDQSLEPDELIVDERRRLGRRQRPQDGDHLETFDEESAVPEADLDAESDEDGDGSDPMLERAIELAREPRAAEAA